MFWEKERKMRKSVKRWVKWRKEGGKCDKRHVL